MKLQITFARTFFLGVALASVLRARPMSAAPTIEHFDVVVVGGSSGGIGAAIGAARLGVSVALIEDTPVLGGMLANGISNIDSYSYEALSGVFEEFRQAVKKHYEPLFTTDPFFKKARSMPTHIDGHAFAAHDSIEGGRWEPKVADQIFKDMAARYPNLKIYYRRFATQTLVAGHRVIGVATETDAGEPIQFYGKAIVDATHEGDVAAWAGAEYRVGREARSALEPHAGVTYFFNQTTEFMPGSTGAQDRAMVSGGLRICIQNFSEEAGTAHVLTTPPSDYKKDDYVQSAGGGTPGVPHGKAEANANPIGNELQVINWDWAEASRAERRRLYDVYKNHALGYLYYLQHERGLIHLGLPIDEFVDNGFVPYRVFIRESRRIEGVVMMTEADINPFINGDGGLPALRKDSIGIGFYPIDAKPVRPKTDMSTPDKGEGDFFLVNVATAFQVPYGAILPKSVDGLLVPVALSATHIAFSAIRMDPTWTVLGQAAGVAAALSAKRGIVPRDLPVEDLQRALLQQKVKLTFYWDVAVTHPAFKAIQMLTLRGIAVRDPDRSFRPDAPFTRVDAARLLYRAFALWPSVSNVHFDDVPYTHPAFREIETLFDHGALSVFGVERQWPKEGGYNAAKHSGFAHKNKFDTFHLERPVTKAELTHLIRYLQAGGGPLRAQVAAAAEAPSIPSDTVTQPLTRGQACVMVWSAVHERDELTRGDPKTDLSSKSEQPE